MRVCQMFFVQLEASYDCTCGLAVDQTVHCWGCNKVHYVFPPGMDGPPGLYTQITGNYHNHCGVRVDGSINCWGKPRVNSSIQCVLNLPATIRQAPCNLHGQKTFQRNLYRYLVRIITAVPFKTMVSPMQVILLMHPLSDMLF
jgi:hypothetical protein